MLKLNVEFMSFTYDGMKTNNIQQHNSQLKYSQNTERRIVF